MGATAISLGNIPMEDANQLDLVPRSPELMRPADTALLVIDVQERLMAVEPDGPRVAWNCRRLLDGARILGVRAFATEQYPEKLGTTIQQLAERIAEPIPEKMAFSCSGCAALFADWQQQGIRRVLVCGIETHVCVQQSVLDLLAAGYQVLVAADAVGARYKIDHNYALRRMEASGAILTTTEAALFEWCGVAGTDEFRAISNLAKEEPPVLGKRQ